MVEATKETIKILLDVDSEGYVIGYQSEFFDGSKWVTPFDTSNAVDLTQAEIDKIVLGASKLIDGEIVVDKAKQAELEAEANKPEPTSEQKMIATLMAKVTELEAKNE